ALEVAYRARAVHGLRGAGGEHHAARGGREGRSGEAGESEKQGGCRCSYTFTRCVIHVCSPRSESGCSPLPAVTDRYQRLPPVEIADRQSGAVVVVLHLGTHGPVAGQVVVETHAGEEEVVFAALEEQGVVRTVAAVLVAQAREERGLLVQGVLTTGTDAGEPAAD